MVLALRWSWLFCTAVQALIGCSGEDRLLDWLIGLQIDYRLHQLIENVGQNMLYMRCDAM